jgi:hypothetical protein
MAAVRHGDHDGGVRRGVIVGFAVVLAGAGAVVATPARADAALVVTPAVDLLDGQTVHVHADGLPDEAITIEECNGGSCRNLVDGPVTPVAGVVDRDVVIRRRVGALWWMFDECAAAPGQCIIRLRSMTTFATLATAPLDFDESVPLVVPTVSLASSRPHGIRVRTWRLRARSMVRAKRSLLVPRGAHRRRRRHARARRHRPHHARR